MQALLIMQLIARWCMQHASAVGCFHQGWGGEDGSVNQPSIPWGIVVVNNLVCGFLEQPESVISPMALMPAQ